MTYIKIRTPEVIAAEEQARKAALRQSFAVNRSAPPAPPLAEAPTAELAATTVSINISLPSLRMPKLSADQLTVAKNFALKLSERSQKAISDVSPVLKHHFAKASVAAAKVPRKQAIQASACIVVLTVLATGGIIITNNIKSSRREAAMAAAAKKVASSTSVTAKPSFAPVTPENKTALAAGEAGKTAFDNKRQTFSYSDTLQGRDITVSQQPLPTNFKTAEAAVTAIAKDLGAKQPIITNRGTAFMLTDPKSNQQVVVYSYNDLLLFIKSPFTHTNEDWQKYLETLKQTNR